VNVPEKNYKPIVETFVEVALHNCTEKVSFQALVLLYITIYLTYTSDLY
jgi:hypothetical protein